TVACAAWQADTPGEPGRVSARSPPGADATRLAIGSSLNPAETPLPPREVAQGLVQGRPVEVGPALFRDPEFGIGNLPQQEIADAHLPSGPDQQIRVRHPSGVQRVADGRFVD